MHTSVSVCGMYVASGVGKTEGLHRPRNMQKICEWRSEAECSESRRYPYPFAAKLQRGGG